MSNIITKKYLIAAPIEQVWQALVDPTQIKEWSEASAKMGEEVAFEFELWDGDVTGVNTVIDKPSRLVQEWRGGDWPKPSVVTFELKSIDDHTEVDLTQTGHPAAETKDLTEGWDVYYMGAIKKYLEDKN